MSIANDSPPSEFDVVHDEEGHRYLLRRDGEHVGVLDYRVVDGGDSETFDLHHTEIRPDARGHGLGGLLVRGALDDLRDAGRKVIPTCWYVREFIGANDEYESLLATA